MKRIRMGVQAAVVFVVVGTWLLMVGCASNVYKSPTFESQQRTHETIALLPFQVAIEEKNRPRDETKQDMQKLAAEQQESLTVALHAQFSKEQEKGKFTVAFQPIGETSERLEQGLKANPEATTVGDLLPAEISEILNVDAVMVGHLTLSKPMGAAMALLNELVLMRQGVTNKGTLYVTIYDGASGDIIWRFNDEIKGGLLSSPASVAKTVVKRVASKFPYKAK